MIPTRKNNSGFTLIELLAVLLIIGLAVGISVPMLAGKGPKRELDDVGEKFIEYADYMNDLAVLNNEPMGLVLVPPSWADKPKQNQGWSYRWQRFIQIEDADGNPQMAWRDIENTTPIEIPDDIEVFVELEGKLWDWSAGPKTKTPIFVLFPSGESEPTSFRLRLVSHDLSVEPQTFQLDQYGRLVWVENTKDFVPLVGDVSP